MSGSTLTSTSSKEIKKEEVHQRASFREDQVVVFQLDRQRRMSAMKAREATELERVGEFLTYVVEGEQDKAEGLLQEMPWLALKKGDVTDLSKREFKHITGFQYALWALDWHMWRMLLKYLTEEEAGYQLRDWESQVNHPHGKHASWQKLIYAYAAYSQNPKLHSSMEMVEIRKVQLSLPTHVVNEYCYESRPFCPVPDFGNDGVELKRSRLIEQGRDWYDTNGSPWPLWQYTGGPPLPHGAIIPNVPSQEGVALAALLEVRLRQRADLVKRLTRYLVAKDLQVHFPVVLVSTILGYLG